MSDSYLKRLKAELYFRADIVAVCIITGGASLGFVGGGCLIVMGLSVLGKAVGA